MSAFWLCLALSWGRRLRCPCLEGPFSYHGQQLLAGRSSSENWLNLFSSGLGSGDLLLPFQPWYL